MLIGQHVSKKIQFISFCISTLLTFLFHLRQSREIRNLDQINLIYVIVTIRMTKASYNSLLFGSEYLNCKNKKNQ